MGKKLKNTRFLAITSCVLLILLVGVSGSQKNEIQEKEAEISSLEVQVEQLQGEASSLEDENSALKTKEGELESLADQSERMLGERESSITALEAQASGQSQAVRELTDRMSSAESAYESLSKEHETCQAASSNKNNKADSSDSENARSLENDASDSREERNEVTVYWVPSGKVYHYSENCSTLKRSKTIYSGTISESGKSRACKVCS